MLKTIFPIDTYDNAGNIKSQITSCGTNEKPSWRTVKYDYDARNRLPDTILIQDDSNESRTRNVYDKVGNKLEVYTGMTSASITGAAKTSYTYDRFGNVEAMADPMGKVERYGRGKTGLLNTKTDRNGNRTVYTYDALDRLIKETVTVVNPSGALTTERTYSHTATGSKASVADTEIVGTPASP